MKCLLFLTVMAIALAQPALKIELPDGRDSAYAKKSAPAPPVGSGGLVIPLKDTGWTLTGSYYTGPARASAYAGGLQFAFQNASTNSFDGYFTTNVNRNASGLTTLSVTLAVTTTGSPVFNYDSQAVNTCISPATARPFLWSATNVNSDQSRWWSNPTAYVLAPGQVTLVVPLTPDRWSDVDGEFATANSTTAAGFAATLTNLGQVGLTFGGGCFFGHGVNVSGGTATFALLDYRLY